MFRMSFIKQIALQVLAQGKRERPEHYIEKIAKISADDLKQIGKNKNIKLV